VTPLYPQKLALTSPTGGGRSVGIVRSRTKATEEFSGHMNCIRVTEDRKLCGVLANAVLILELNTVMDLLVEQFI